MSVSLKANAAGTQAELLLNGAVVATIDPTPNNAKSLVTKDYVDGKNGMSAIISTNGQTSYEVDIPTGVSDIEILFDSVSLNGTETVSFQVGGASGFVTAGYSSVGASMGNTANSVTTSAAQFILSGATAANQIAGIANLSRMGNSNDWVCGYSCFVTTAAPGVGGGRVSMTEELTKLRFKGSAFANAFDGGTICVKWRF
jgi:hypothetical protein